VCLNPIDLTAGELKEIASRHESRRSGHQPFFQYRLWISKREFAFHHHVAFDQLVTPMTHYIRRSRVETKLPE
jgi:hypothetical protein